MRVGEKHSAAQRSAREYADARMRGGARRASFSFPLPLIVHITSHAGPCPALHSPGLHIRVHATHLLRQGRFQLLLQLISRGAELPPLVVKELRVDARLAQERGLS